MVIYMINSSAIRPYFSLDILSGVITWCVVAGMSLFVMFNNQMPTLNITLACVLYLAYIVLWLCLVSEAEYPHDKLVRYALMLILVMIVTVIYFAVPLAFNGILMGIIGGSLPHYLSIKRALIVGSLAALPLYFVYAFYWDQDYMFLSASLFWTFNMFAIIMVNATVNEKLARAQIEESHRQLLSTQALLKEASKQSERVRIARNIHDLLGHHLTALTINLQVASLKTEGDVKQSIEQCHQLAKLLLSDVREAVSDIRDKSQVDLQAAIYAMAQQVPNLSIDIDFSDNLKIYDIEIADTLMKCIQESITNTLKHSRNHQMSIVMSQDSHMLKLRIQSDGKMPEKLILGNGLKGMRERIEMISGKINFSLNKHSLITDVMIPLNNEQLS